METSKDELLKNIAYIACVAEYGGAPSSDVLYRFCERVLDVLQSIEDGFVRFEDDPAGKSRAKILVETADLPSYFRALLVPAFEKGIEEYRESAQTIVDGCATARLLIITAPK